MKKVFKWILIVIGVIILFILLDLLLFMFTGHSWIGGDAPDTKQTEQLKQENTEGKKQDSDKPENYIENINLDETIQKGYNQRMMLVGHFERENMSAEDKIAFAQETKDRINPEIRTLSYDMRNGDQPMIYVYISNAYGSIQNMCEDTIEYYQNGDENAKTEFYDQSQRALEQLQKADQELKNQ